MNGGGERERARASICMVLRKRTKESREGGLTFSTVIISERQSSLPEDAKTWSQDRLAFLSHHGPLLLGDPANHLPSSATLATITTGHSTRLRFPSRRRQNIKIEDHQESHTAFLT